MYSATTDTTFLNHQAWAIRWFDRAQSIKLAENVIGLTLGSGPKRPKSARRRNGLAMRTLAWQAVWRGDMVRAEEDAHRAIARLKDTGADHAIADALGVLALVHFNRNRRDLALQTISEAFSLRVPEHHASTLIDRLVVSSLIHLSSGRFDLAQSGFEQALTLANGPDIARVHINIAQAQLLDKRPSEALDQLEQACDSAEEHQNLVIQPYICAVKAQTYVELDQTCMALKAISKAIPRAVQSKDVRAEIVLSLQHARVLRAENRVDAAIALALTAQKRAKEAELVLFERQLLMLCAELFESQGQQEEELAQLRRLVQIDKPYI